MTPYVADPVYLNGQFLPLADAGISPLDRGFLYGDGVYELIPVYSRRAFRIDEHLKRLLKDKAVSEDDERRGQDDVQRLTDRVVAEIDRLVQSKEAEVLAV